MARRDEIIAFCDELLGITGFADYGPNGLQVPGTREVSKVATGVTANRELIARARDGGAELLLAHHGLLFGDAPAALSEQQAERLRVALCAELSVAGYHLPLDAHPEVGNNALLAECLDLEPTGRAFAEFKGNPIGTVARSAGGLGADELRSRIADAVGREPLVFACGPERIETVGIVAGGGSRALAEAIALGLDAFVTGEPSEHVMGEAREGGIHFLAAGHYATETFGIRRLGELVAERFSVAHEFIDVPNPI
ncbi:MAG TPA: Nif3-like dinuclear metal center hexameric protein [Solirubrobacterales bacterium]|nr:Nif3-like dinuclear metal center hexameric protein [Solirubrobacterales bacterium]